VQHPYKELEPTIAAQLNRATILQARQARIEAVAKHLLTFKDKYAHVSAGTGVPIIVVAAIHERESDADFSTYLGNGDHLNHPSVHVPRGRGPFTGPNAWAMGAIDALTLDRLNQVTDWSWERAVYEWLLYNGFGPLSHGKQSGYDWAGTNIYDGGKYIRDSVWDASAWDSQLGCYPVAWQMAQFDNSLQLPRAQDVVPAADDAPPAQLTGVGGIHSDEKSTAWIQAALNTLQIARPPLIVDGSYGRMTKQAITAFQDRANITVDGIAGPETISALEAALTVGKIS
jgi:lysozyme family protein